MRRFIPLGVLGMTLVVFAGCGSGTQPSGDVPPDKQAASIPASENPAEVDEVWRVASAETAAAIREMIPVAAGMSLADMEKLDLPNDMQRPSATDNKSLSLMACCYLHFPRAINEARWQEFRYKGSSGFSPVPSGEELFAELSRSQAQGYGTMIQPDRITGFTCETKGDLARGAVTFDVPDVLEGTVQYVAERGNDGWQIKEFQLPAHAYRFVRHTDGTWKWFLLFGEIDKYPPPLHGVSGKITVDGQPLTGGRIEFHHAVDNLMTGYGRIAEDGTYSVELAVGSYHVSLQRPEPPVPEKYTLAGETGLMFDVQEGDNKFDLDLTER